MATNFDQYTDLTLEIRSALPTNDAAFHLNRKPQTLRTWACFENGPIKPVKINGRLAWLVSDIRDVIKGGPRKTSKTHPSISNH